LLLEQDTDASEDAEYMVFMAKDLGGTSEIDGQGRVLVPAALRKLLSLENEPVWLNCYKSRINMLGKAVYEEMQAKYMENTVERLRKFERKGLK
jgi:DNA-binding transcriptional regulator/RsmH inhibitor MraZ